MTARAERTPWGPLLGTIVFVAAVPGSVVVLVPWWLSGGRVAGTTLGIVVGMAMIVAALPLFVSFCSRFVWEGRGTPAPIAPTQHLVVGGPYRWVRNPGYVAVTTILVGEALFYGSLLLLLWAAVAWIAFNFFVVLYEEPTLQRRFGPAYETYMEHVPRWIPSRPRIITPHPQMKLATLVYALRDEQVPWCVVPPTRIAGCGSRRAASSSPANRPRSVRYAKCAKRRVSRSMIPCCAR